MSNRERSNGRYILVGDEPMAEPDLFVWAAWIETHDRRVALTTIADGIEVSTVFLGLDHRFGPGEPILFETMVFAAVHPDLNGDTVRYSTWDEAEAGHAAMVQRVKAALIFV